MPQYKIGNMSVHLVVISVQKVSEVVCCKYNAKKLEILKGTNCRLKFQAFDIKYRYCAFFSVFLQSLLIVTQIDCH